MNHASYSESKGIIMNQQELLSKLSDLKVNIQHLLEKRSHRKVKGHSSSETEHMDEEEGHDNYLDDLPLTINRDPSPGIKFYTTENSEFARGAEREVARGIDSFGEDQAYEDDDHLRQT